MPTPFVNEFGAVSVKDPTFGAVGNGTHDDTGAIQSAFDYAFGTSAAPHGDSGKTSNVAVFFPAGLYKITSPLTIRSLRGGYVYGEARQAVTIKNFSGGSVIVTNGCDYSRFERLNLDGGGSGTCFDLDWDNTGSVALQSNTFSDMAFGNASIGLSIGTSGNMGSENTIQNCYISQCSTGLRIANQNALENMMIGGNIANCSSYGSHIDGSCYFYTVSFQVNTTWDVLYDTGQDPLILVGCRSEQSSHFVSNQISTQTILIGCSQTQTGGVFADVANGTLIASGNIAGGGLTGGYESILHDFGNGWPAGYLTNFQGTFGKRQSAGDFRVTKTTNYSVLVSDFGKQFDNLGAGASVQFTLPSCDARFGYVGAKLGFYIGAAQTLTIKAPTLTAGGGGATLRIAGNVSAAAGTISASTIGNYVEIELIDAVNDGSLNTITNTWVAKSHEGTWTVT